ncbi:MAG: hypothetical protein A2V86_12145 [Deltaproteobacteria bacterium RBG_16_49_23]|nr:MAG: hypothetical protein A2V86_12145 [Deltaproteobacteria bacterium RBG_16_49_23]
MKKIVEERKEIAFFIKMFPLKIHPAAYQKSKTIVCEKSLALLEEAFEKKALPPPKCETTAVDETIKLTERLGITSTPVSVMPDGRIITGYKDAKSFLLLIAP